MSYIVCSASGCGVELRQNDAYACDVCWREGMSKSPRVEWQKFSDNVDGATPTKKCDYCHHRNSKWHTQSTICNSCYIKENYNFKEDVTNTLTFLRELHPSPKSKDFKGDVTLVVTGRDTSPHGDNDAPHHNAAAPDSHDQQHPDGNPDDQQHHQETAGSDHIKHHDRPWADIPISKRPRLRIQAHRFILASKSSVFRKMFEREAKQKIEEARQKIADEMTERLRHLREGDHHDDEHSVEKKQRHKKHVDHHEDEQAVEMKEKPEPGVFHVEGVTGSVLRAVINFMYTAEIQFTEKVEPLEVLRFAHEYDIPWLKQVCETELAKSITVKNLSEILRLSYRWKAEHLKKAARKFFEEHPEFHNDVLDALLASDS